MPTKSVNGASRKVVSDRISFFALVAVVIGLSALLIGRTIARGDDFLVFYQVARRFFAGVRPYDQTTYGNMVFKYPPWVLPFFLPFGWLDPITAKTVWGIIEAAALVAVVVRLHRGLGELPPVRPAVQALFLLLFFGLFGSHGMTGQITLVVLALAVWTDPLQSPFSRFFFLVLGFSAKVISLFPLVHSIRRKHFVRSALGIGLIFALLSLPIYFKSYQRHYGLMREQWVAAMFSGTKDVNSVRIGFTTREVQGLPSFILRKSDLDERKPAHVLFATLFSIIGIGGGWAWLSRKRSRKARWIGWIALVPAVQPLAWFHVFLFTYPVFVFGFESALRENREESRRWRTGGFLFCALLVGVVGQKTMGALGYELEFASIKLWGTLGAALLFITRPEKRESTGFRETRTIVF